jgi:hypothetical protein
MKIELTASEMTAKQARDKRYRESPEGKAAMKRYRESPECKALKKRYRESPAGKAAQKRYTDSPKRKAAQKRYRESLKGKATKAAWLSSPNGIENIHLSNWSCGAMRCTDCGQIFAADSVLEKGWERVGLYRCVCDLCRENED